MTIGEKIYELRTRQNMSQGKLSEILDVSRQSVSKWENNVAVPDLDKIIKLSEVFGVTVDELVKGEPHLEISEKPVQVTSSFPARKIFGTVLLSLGALIFILLLFFNGGFFSLIYSLPFLLCGAICFVFRKNIGLWCGWALFLSADIFFRYATGVNWKNIIYTFKWNASMNYFILFVSWAEFVFLFCLVLKTVLKFRKTPLKNKYEPLILWGIYVLIKLCVRLFSKTIITYFLLYFLNFYISIAVFTIALSSTAKFIHSKRPK